MDHFQYRDGELFAEELLVEQLADRFGTPLYLYSRATLSVTSRPLTRPLGTIPTRSVMR